MEFIERHLTALAILISACILAWAIVDYTRASRFAGYIAVIEKILIAVATIIVPILVAYYGSQITKTLGFKNHDFLILQHFHNIFGCVPGCVEIRIFGIHA
jgi:hypothetical protein